MSVSSSPSPFTPPFIPYNTSDTAITRQSVSTETPSKLSSDSPVPDHFRYECDVDGPILTTPHYIRYNEKSPWEVADEIRARIEGNYKIWEENKDIRQLMSNPELFAFFCHKVRGLGYFSLTSSPERDGIELLRCVLAESLLSKKDFQISAIPYFYDLNWVILIQTPKENRFTLSSEEKKQSVLNYTRGISPLFKAICNISGHALTKTKEKFEVCRYDNPNYYEQLEIEVLNFNLKA